MIVIISEFGHLQTRSHTCTFTAKVSVVFEKNKMVGACSTYGGEERRIQGFGGET